MTGKDVVRALTPPLLLALRRRWSGDVLQFRGRPESWTEACRMSSGYSAEHILDRVVAATRAVVAGQARFERDSVLFDTPELPFPILSALMRAAALDAGRLHVLDFGGSLGSTFRQCEPFLKGLAAVDWWIVEQPEFVAAGQAEFATKQLHFVGSLTEAPPCPSALVLASSVLQYLEDPMAVLDQFAQLPSRHLVIDRTPMSGASTHHLCIQNVPASIYRASYPCWILARESLLARLEQHWHIIGDFPSPEGHARTADGLAFEFRGLILERQS